MKKSLAEKPIRKHAKKIFVFSFLFDFKAETKSVWVAVILRLLHKLQGISLICESVFLLT